MHPPYQQPPHSSPVRQQGMSAGAKVALAGCGGCGALIGLVLMAGCVAAIVAPADPAPPAAESSAAGSASPEESVSPSPEPSETPEDEVSFEELGFPPALEGEERAAYLADVRDLDRGFVFPDEDSVVARGQDVCVTLRDEGEQAAIDYIEAVWLHEDYDFGRRPTTTEEAERLLEIVHEHVCPDW